MFTAHSSNGGARHRDYRHYAVSQVVNTSVNLCLCLFLGALVSGYEEGLVIGLSGGFFAGALYMCWIWRKIFTVAEIGFRLPTLPLLWKAAVKYRHMPLQVLPFTILVVIMQSALPLVLGLHYSLAEVGFYALASRALLAPGAIIGAAIGEPFRAELAARMRQGQKSRINNTKTYRVFDGVSDRSLFLHLLNCTCAFRAPIWTRICTKRRNCTCAVRWSVHTFYHSATYLHVCYHWAHEKRDKGAGRCRDYPGACLTCGIEFPAYRNRFELLVILYASVRNNTCCYGVSSRAFSQI